ncbi:MAG: hypothetical protein EPN82_05905 [Bacteroidetes bacterium]|nr:MAG: hypothetical protein EPN82_05905 [Bacteroidota bacterium]
MLIIIQYPITDLRRFIEYEKSYLKFPQWPFPNDSEFVRGMGPVRYRRAGGVNNWVGESKICFAKQSIKIDNSTFKSINGIKLKLKFRRFYFDGIASGKFEIAFQIESNVKYELRILLQQIFNINVQLKIPTQNTEHCNLINIPRYLAKQYIFATSYLNKIENNINNYIHWDNPIIFIVSHEYKDLKIQNNYNKQILTLNYPYFVTISHSLIDIKNKQIHLWHLKRSDYSYKSSEIARNIRIIILKLNSIRSTFNIILNSINQEIIIVKSLSLQSNILQKYLLDIIKKIDQVEDNIKMDDVLMIVKQIEEKLTAGLKFDILNKLETIINIRPQILKKIEDYFNKIEKYNLLSKNSKEIKMSEIEITNVGNGNVFKIDDESISIIDSFNKVNDTELLKLLIFINSELENIKNSFKPDDYINLKKDVKLLIEENKTDNPRKDRNIFYLDNIKKIITKTGEIGVPILEIVDKVISFFK